MNAYLPEALLLGLSTGPICLAYCAPVLVPFVVAEERARFAQTARLLSLFLLGRLGGYLVIGFLAGLLGTVISAYASGSLPAIASLLMGGMLLVFGFLKNFPQAKLCRPWAEAKPSNLWPLGLGLLTGLNICPPFVAAITGSATTGTIQGALLYFMAFFLGTALFTLPIAILGPLSRVEAARNIARVCLILSGAWLVIKGILLLIGG